MKASLQTTMFCKRKAYGLLIIQQNDKSTQTEDVWILAGESPDKLELTDHFHGFVDHCCFPTEKAKELKCPIPVCLCTE